jgi:hypothetical protein
MNDTLTLVGFHGTSEANARRIEQVGFQPSESGWLGYGTYFFLEGISDPVQDAAGWAIGQAYDRSKGSYRYDEYCVLEIQATLEPIAIFDLRQEVGLHTFHSMTSELKREVIDHHYNDGDQLDKLEIGDEALLEVIVDSLSIQGFISWFYSQVDPRERRLRRQGNNRFRIPNVTVFCLRDVACIDANSIRIVKEGRCTDDARQ